MVAQLLTQLRNAPDRLLHGRRRRRAREALAARPRPQALLVVCNGNIFRSPFAAAVLRRRLAPLGVRVESGGFVVPGRATPPDAVAAAAKRGVDLTTHRSQLLTEQLVGWADLIVVVEAMQRRAICERFGRSPVDVVLLGDFDPDPIASREIEDPVEQGQRVCEVVYARIERCAAELASVLERAPRPANTRAR